MGTGRRAGIRLRWAGLHGRAEPGEAEDLAGEAAPGDDALAGEVEGAAELGPGQQGGEGVGQGEGGGGVAVLVVDDAQGTPRVGAGVAEDGVDEAGAAGAVKPGGAGDDVVGAEGADGLLAGELAGAVDGRRGGGLFLGAVAGAESSAGQFSR